MTILLTQDELHLAERVARRAASRWSLAEFDDIHSHLQLWMVEHASILERYRVDQMGAGKLYVTLRREASKFSAAEQEARVGRPLREDNFYTPNLVSRVLPFVFQDWPQTTVPVNPVTGQPASAVPHQSDVALAVLADVSGAFHGLDRETKKVLTWRFQDDLTFAEISDLTGITESGAMKRVERAVQRIVDALSGNRL